MTATTTESATSLRSYTPIMLHSVRSELVRDFADCLLVQAPLTNGIAGTRDPLVEQGAHEVVLLDDYDTPHRSGRVACGRRRHTAPLLTSIGSMAIPLTIARSAKTKRLVALVA